MSEVEVEFDYNSLKGDIALLGLEIPTLLINYLKEINQEDLYITPLITNITNKVLEVISKNSEYKLYTRKNMKEIFYVGIQLGINQNIAMSSENIKLQDEEDIFNKFIKNK